MAKHCGQVWRRKTKLVTRSASSTRRELLDPKVHEELKIKLSQKPSLQWWFLFATCDMFYMIEVWHENTFRSTFLRRVPILKHLSDYEVAKIAHVAERETYDNGQFIIREATVGDTFYIIVRGQCDVFQGPFSIIYCLIGFWCNILMSDMVKCKRTTHRRRSTSLNRASTLARRRCWMTTI